MTRRKPKNGLHTRYYDNGQQLSEEHYQDGKLDGKWTFWYENGQIKLEANFKPYEVLAEDCRAERSNPSVFPARDSKDGKWTEWYEDGQKKLEGNYEDGGLPGIRHAIRECKWTQWDENGQIIEELYFKNGKLQDWKITRLVR